MNEIVSKIAFQIPDLVALCLIVMIFVRHLDKRDDLLRDLHREHLDARSQSREMIRETHSVLERNTEALVNVTTVIERCKPTRL